MKYPSHCCQKCGDEIGWLGRLLQFARLSLHRCKPKKPWTIDRDGRVRTDARPVVLKAADSIKARSQLRTATKSSRPR